MDNNKYKARNMDTSNYHQMTYSPYSQMINPSSQASPYAQLTFANYQPQLQSQQQQQQKQQQQTSSTSGTVPIDYSPYNNYLYQSALPADAYHSSYYGNKSQTPNHMVASVNNGYMAGYATANGKSTPVHSIGNEKGNNHAYQAYQTSVQQQQQQQQQQQKTANEFNYDSCKPKAPKESSNSQSTRNSDQSAKDPSNASTTTHVTMRTKKQNNTGVTMRNSSNKNSQALDEIQQKHKSMYYEPAAVADLLKPSQNGVNELTARENKRFSLMDDYNFMTQLNQLHESIEKRKNTNKIDAIASVKEGPKHREVSALEKGSPLFLKIMSKLSELPDMSRSSPNTSGPAVTHSGAPGAPGNSIQTRMNQTTTVSSMSTDSKLTAEAKNELECELKGDNTSFSLPSIKMTDKVMGSLNCSGTGASNNNTSNNNKPNIVIVRRSAQSTPVPTSATPTFNMSMERNQMNSKRLSIYPESIESFGNNTTLNQALAKELDDTSIISAAPSAQSSKPLVVTTRNHASNKEPINYADRYTSYIDTPLDALTTTQAKRQQQPNKPSPISKEIEDSLKNYFAYLNGINSASPNATARATGGAGAKDTSKKYNTVNPNNYALFEKRQRPKSPVVSAYTTKSIEPVTIQKSTGICGNESNGNNKNNKFATVNATDLKKKINDAFLLLSESQQQQHDRQELEQLKQRNRRSKVTADSDLLQLDTEIDSIVENISKAEDSKRQSVFVETTKTQNARVVSQSFERGSRDEVKTTEEIEKAADFSQSSNESMVKLAEDMRDIKQTGLQKQRKSVSSTTPVPVRVSESSQEQTLVVANAVNGVTGEHDNRASEVTVTNDTDAVSTGSDGDGQAANPVHKIEIRLKTNELLMKNESVEPSLVFVDRDYNIDNQPGIHVQPRMKTVTRSELGYDPRRHSKRYETPTSEISAAASVIQASMGSEVSGPKIKLRPKPATSERTALNSSNRRSNLIEQEKNNPLHSYRYQRMINSRPKTELKEPLQKNSRQSSQDQVLTMTRGARKLSTPPPTPPLVDRADESKSVSSRDGHSKYSTQENGRTSLRPVSITSSIRSNKPEHQKPMRVNHGPPPPPDMVSRRQSYMPMSTSPAHNHNHPTTTGHNQYSSGENREKSVRSAHRQHRLSQLPQHHHGYISEKAKAYHTEYEKYLIYLQQQQKQQQQQQQPTSKQRTSSSKRETVHVEHNSVNGKTSSRRDKSPAVPNGHKSNRVSVIEEMEDSYSGRNTNLPQLGKIDYIYKTNDDQLMTSFGSYNEDKRISSKLGKSKQSPSTDSQVETNSRSCKVSQKPRDNSRSQQVTTPTSQQYSYNSVDQYQYNVNTTQQQQQQQKHNHVETAAAAINNDNALPWKTDAKNGKNFYENYSKENDRRKKEGNGFLMLLPGIAIPIDTDADNSDEENSSNDSN